MSCKELSLDYAAYALGVLDEDQRSEISRHLANQCPDCVPGVGDALAVVGSLSGSVRLSDPSSRLRNRIVAMVGGETKKQSWFAIGVPWALAAGLAVLLYAMVVNPTQRGSETNPDSAKLQQALYVLNDPDARDATFGVAQKPSSGRVFVSPRRGIVFVASNLPPLGAGKAFELWVIPGAGKPIPVGTFASQSDSSAVHIWPNPVESTAAAVAVTVEPAGGSPQPTTTPFIVATLLPSRN